MLNFSGRVAQLARNTCSISAVEPHSLSGICKQAKRNLQVESKYIVAKLQSEFSRYEQLINDASLIVSREEDIEKVKVYLKAMTDSQDDIESVFWGAPNNLMIDGSGWIPPKDYNLTSRPWYRKAAEGK